MSRSRLTRLQLLLMLVLTASFVQPSTLSASEPEAYESKSAYTDDVLKIAYAYKNGGGYIWKNSTGVCETLEHDGKTILKKQPKGTYCCGFTFQAAFKLAQHHGIFDGKTYDEVKKFQRQWYGASEASGETQCTLAMTTLGVGDAVAHDDARAGDFGNFWRTKSGHSIIFLNWITDDDGNRTGIHYRSSQPKTDGIGDHTEYFKDHGGHVDPERLYLCRFTEPESEEEAGDEPKRGANR
jgi:hypothetical protein